MKYAGWDHHRLKAKPRSPKQILYIHNDHVELREAFRGTRAPALLAAMIAQETNADASIGVIGPAAVPCADVKHDVRQDYSAGGVGDFR